ncbi:phospholipid hydroperoxide glutathione peroxidase-like [Oppia nitens]|uniref:phospholipid hydroperoxide glutathione peroxidase-like n=1 Tax=Oppia nitens TaxID=1686743 RepID=UPI0023DC37D1|nr:phospholipid hydroperoxide glutathione peroxidase-like [Oppia nitens]
MANNTTNGDPKSAKTMYEFSAKDLDGNEVPLDRYKGHPTLVVNVASSCGLQKTNTKQLNELYAKYEAQGLRILAFPSNQFNQEKGCDVDIKEFAKKNDVHYDMMSKVDVNGESAHPVYKWLKNQQGGFISDAIKWNYTKFLVDKHGIPIKRYAPTVEPKDIEKDLKAQL